MPRYIILGAEAVGGALGGRLRLGGHDVVLVARGDHLAALRERGLRLRTPAEDITQHLPAIEGPEEIDINLDDIPAGAKPGDTSAEELADYLSDGRRMMRFSAQSHK
jgi:hypothetical protein